MAAHKFKDPFTQALYEYICLLPKQKRYELFYGDKELRVNDDTRVREGEALVQS